MAVDYAGNLYVADITNHRISKGVPIVGSGPPQILLQPQSETVAAGSNAVLSVAVGNQVRIDYLNRLGPTNAWVTLDTVTLTNTTQFYPDLAMFRQPRGSIVWLPRRDGRCSPSHWLSA